MAKIGLFYGSNTGFTEEVTDRIKELLDNIEPGLAEVFNISQTTPEAIAQWDCPIFGIPTVNVGQLQDNWDVF